MKTEYKVHCFYILTILVSIIIGLISVEWANVPKLVDYITFALTLSSLILAGLAIVYSIYSNTSISSSLSYISSAAKEVATASEDIKSSNRELRSEVEKLPLRLDSVDENISNTQKTINELIDIRESQAPRLESSHIPKEDVSLSDEMVVKFMNNSSVRGLEFLLMAYLSHKTKTSFKVSDITKEVEGYPENNEYLTAYKVATSALGIIESTLDGQHRDVYTFIHPKVAENICTILREKVTEIAKDIAEMFEENEEDRIKESLNDLNKIAMYFGEQFSK